MKYKYVIHSASECGWWNNKIGWVYNVRQATQIPAVQKEDYQSPLPLSKGNDAEWVVAEYHE